MTHHQVCAIMLAPRGRLLRRRQLRASMLAMWRTIGIIWCAWSSQTLGELSRCVEWLCHAPTRSGDGRTPAGGATSYCETSCAVCGITVGFAA